MSDDIPADPPVEPRSAPGASAPSRTSSTVISTSPIRTARTRSRSRTAVPRRTAQASGVLGGGTDVVAGWAVPRLSLLGLFLGRGGPRQEGVVITDAEGNVLAYVPRARMGYRVVARFHTRRGVGQLVEARNDRRLRGRRLSTDPAYVPTRWTNDGDVDPAWMPDGTLSTVATSKCRSTAARHDSSYCPMLPTRPTDRASRTSTASRWPDHSSSPQPTVPTLERWWGVGFSRPPSGRRPVTGSPSPTQRRTCGSPTNSASSTWRPAT